MLGMLVLGVRVLSVCHFNSFQCFVTHINKGKRRRKVMWGGGKELKLRKGEEFSIPTFHTVASPTSDTSVYIG